MQLTLLCSIKRSFGDCPPFESHECTAGQDGSTCSHQVCISTLQYYWSSYCNSSNKRRPHCRAYMYTTQLVCGNRCYNWTNFRYTQLYAWHTKGDSKQKVAIKERLIFIPLVTQYILYHDFVSFLFTCTSLQQCLSGHYQHDEVIMNLLYCTILCSVCHQ